MKDLQIFQNNEFGEIRTVLRNGEPYFNLNDTCRILEIKNSSDAKSRLSEPGVVTTEVGVVTGEKSDGTDAIQFVQANFINESNLYKLIFQSRKPQAERFSEWVTSEVLPSIRKHGGYLTPEKLEEVLINPDVLIKLATNLKEEQELRRGLELEREENKQKVLFANSVETASNSCLVGELAKLISQNGYEIGQNRLFKWLRENGYLIRQKGENYNLPTQYSMELGLMEIKKRTINNPDGSVRLTSTTKITGKGQIYFVDKFIGQEKAM